METVPGVVSYIFNRIRFDGNGCWTWTGSVQAGIPKVSALNHSVMGPTRKFTCEDLAAAARHGRSVYAEQTCGNSLCVNPDHMRLSRHGGAGTKRRAGGRFASSITEADRNEIFTLYRAGHSQRALAVRFRTSQSTISRIIREAKND